MPTYTDLARIQMFKVCSGAFLSLYTGHGSLEYVQFNHLNGKEKEFVREENRADKSLNGC